VLERDFFMSAAEARGFGLVDEVIERRPASETEQIAAHAAADPARKWTFF
jgi:enoyl-CoA hydratase/carnithine racemase